jgi:hypothetical protein
MTWADFYLICFAAGFAFSLFSFLGGRLHWHLHFPHISHAGGHVPVGNCSGVGGKGSVPGNQISPFNFPSLAAFLAWFGGTGYLLSRYSTVWFVTGIGISSLVGLTGAAIIFLFLSRVLTSEEENLDPADFEMTGVLGRLSMPIRAGGTGEIVYSQAGTRRTCGARSEDGRAMAKGAEVVVTRYEKGIAQVQLWTELAGEGSSDSTAQPGPRKTGQP